MFFKTEADDTEQLTFMDAVNYIKAQKNDKPICVGEMYYTHLSKNKQAFDDKLLEEDEITVDKVSIGGNDARMIKLLKTLSKCKKFTDEQDEIISKMRTLWENGEIPQSLTKEILKLPDVKVVTDELQTFFEINDRIPERYFAGRNEKRNTRKSEKQVILSCFLRRDDK